MYEIFPVKRRTPRTSMNDQIIRTNLLSGILVVDTGGRVQNIEAMEINYNYPKFVYSYFETFLSPDIPGVISVRRNTLLVMT